MRRIRPGDFDGKRVVWCLDLTWAGTVYRVASEPIDVKAADGTTHSYTGGLDPVSLTEHLGRLKFSTPELSATVRAVLPVSPAHLRARGLDWLSATADLYLTTVDTRSARLTVGTSELTHDEMWLQVSGRPRSPEWGRPGTPPGLVEFSIEVAPWESTDAMINNLGTITAARWPGADADVIGKRYPVIIGHPGVYLDASGNKAYGAGSPAYAVTRTAINADLLLAAGHPPGIAGSVVVTDENGDTTTAPATASTDSEGNPVTIVNISSASPPFTRSDSQFFIAWSVAGGVTADTSAGVLEEAPEVAAYLLARAGLQVDAPAWLALKGRIPRLSVAGYINDDTTAWGYVQQHVLPLMPVGYRFTRQGMAPVVYAPTDHAADTVAHVRTVDAPGAASSGDWIPVGGMSLDTEPEDVPLQLDVAMASDVRTSSPPRSFSWVGTGAGPVSRYIGPRSLKGKSGSIYLDHAATRGASSVQSLDLGQVWDTATVDAVASWRTRLAVMPRFPAEYAAPMHWGWLQVGDAVQITDPLRELAGAFAVVESKTLSGDSWLFTLVVEEDPVRDARATD